MEADPIKIYMRTRIIEIHIYYKFHEILFVGYLVMA